MCVNPQAHITYIYTYIYYFLGFCVSLFSVAYTIYIWLYVSAPPLPPASKQFETSAKIFRELVGKKNSCKVRNGQKKFFFSFLHNVNRKKKCAENGRFLALFVFFFRSPLFQCTDVGVNLILFRAYSDQRNRENFFF